MNIKMMSILTGFIVLMLAVASSAFAVDIPDFDVSIEKVYPNCRGPGDIGFVDIAVCEEKPVDIDIKVTNNGNTEETMFVEVGFYTLEQLEDWGYMSIFSAVHVVPSCNPDEPYVQTISITLEPGEFEVVKVTIKNAPTVTVFTDYYVTAACYKECWTPETGSTLSSWDYTKERVYPIDWQGKVETCTDGLLNQDETSTDCGGDVCEKCGVQGNCLDGDDCISGYCNLGKCEMPSQPNVVNCEGVICDIMRATNMTKTAIYSIIGLIFTGLIILAAMLAKRIG